MEERGQVPNQVRVSHLRDLRTLLGAHNISKGVTLGKNVKKGWVIMITLVEGDEEAKKLDGVEDTRKKKQVRRKQ